MDLFTQIKMAVSVKEAAEYYGLEVNRGNMVCCPFHADRTPSMKLNEDYFYCFGCGATGDVIGLTARPVSYTHLLLSEADHPGGFRAAEYFTARADECP